jgi:hypothetical protein
MYAPIYLILPMVYIYIYIYYGWFGVYRLALVGQLFNLTLVEGTLRVPPSYRPKISLSPPKYQVTKLVCSKVNTQRHQPTNFYSPTYIINK